MTAAIATPLSCVPHTAFYMYGVKMLSFPLVKIHGAFCVRSHTHNAPCIFTSWRLRGKVKQNKLDSFCWLEGEGFTNCLKFLSGGRCAGFICCVKVLLLGLNDASRPSQHGIYSIMLAWSSIVIQEKKMGVTCYINSRTDHPSVACMYSTIKNLLDLK